MDSLTFINLLHIFLIAPVLIYISYNGYTDKPVQPIWYVILFLIGVYAFIYHFYETLDDENPEINRHNIANFLHMIIFAPLVIYVAYYGYIGQTVNKIWYVLFFIFGIWSLVYHMLSLTGYIKHDHGHGHGDGEDHGHDEAHGDTGKKEQTVPEQDNSKEPAEPPETPPKPSEPQNHDH